MVSSFSLLAASLLLGQAAEAQYISPPAAGRAKAVIVEESPSTGPSSGGRLFRRSADSRPLFPRLQGLFNRGERTDTTATPAPAGEPTLVTPSPKLTPTPAPASTTPAPAGEFLHKLPMSKAGKADATDAVTTVSLRQAKSPIRASIANKIGRDEKFEWATGQLEIEGGVYRLYYATPETVDTYHGVVALDTSKVDMHAVRPGDLVSVQGQLTQRGRVVYHLTSIDLIERPNSAK